MTLYPTTKCTPERAADMIEMYGPERMVVDTSGDWGPSRPENIPNFIYGKVITVAAIVDKNGTVYCIHLIKHRCSFLFERIDRGSIVFNELYLHTGVNP